MREPHRVRLSGPCVSVVNSFLDRGKETRNVTIPLISLSPEASKDPRSHREKRDGSINSVKGSPVTLHKDRTISI